ncbi:T9SS type A sorting domain-containing protein [Hymenobacter busanensis]|nr:T9SS type A sorting domain-containing protein [Hymenobacter busanensis]QHJ09423.1 T9SS type A sorting domain-containing protein [Hymenobacter busanensis]
MGSVQAQCTYTSKPGGGAWSDPNTWVISGNANGHLVPTTQLQRNGQDANNSIVIIASDVRLDRDYLVGGDNGKLIINAGASLVEDQAGRSLAFGEQQKADQVRLELNGLLQVSRASFYKADADLGSRAVLRTSCSVALANQSNLDIEAGAVLDIDGNLMVRQGNPSLVGSGTLSISGCVMTQGNGSLNGLFGPNLSVCIQGGASSCAVAEEDRGLQCNPRALDAITVNGCRQPLPVELVSFTARYADRQVVVQWATASEKNSASFAVERSADGKSFETVTTTEAAGNSSSRRSYTAADRRPLSGTSYYRLKQIDLDGTFTYSTALPVTAGSLGSEQLQAYGRAGLLNVEMHGNAPCHMLRVLDSMGRVLYTETLTDAPTGSFVRQLPLQHTGTGVYIVQAVTTEGTVSRKFMMLN